MPKSQRKFVEKYSNVLSFVKKEDTIQKYFASIAIHILRVCY